MKLNYMERLAIAQANGLLPKGLSISQVQHDDWCELLKHGGICNCDPVIQVTANGETFRIDGDGKREGAH